MYKFFPRGLILLPLKVNLNSKPLSLLKTDINMLKRLMPLLLILFASAINSRAQDTMYVHTKDIGIVKIAIDNIDSIIFYDNSKVTDYDGNQYHTITIGTQVWMAENLRVTHDSEGTSITSYTYNNNESNADLYGRLYTWDVAMNGSTDEGAQGICPCGWHIPTDEEFKTLEMYYGMTSDEADIENDWRGEGVGTKFKSSDSTGYRALLSGRRSSSGTYSLLNSYEYVWTSNEYGSYAWRRCIRKSSEDVGRWNTFPKTYAFSVRCIKND